MREQRGGRGGQKRRERGGSVGGVQAGADDKTQGYLRAPWGEKGRCLVWTAAHHRVIMLKKSQRCDAVLVDGKVE